MTKVLIRFNGNWADEMDIFGFRIMEKSHWDTYMARAERFFAAAKNGPAPSSEGRRWGRRLEPGSFEKCVGTNEYIEYNSYDNFATHFSTVDLTEDEEKMMARLFPSEYNGHFAAIGRGEMFEYPDPEDDLIDREY